jgi:hypothetical protein
VWVGDITYSATDAGWLFLAVVIDLFSRQVVGWSLREDMTSTIVIDALRMAWLKRSPGTKAGLIFHSDRGSQYDRSAMCACGSSPPIAAQITIARCQYENQLSRLLQPFVSTDIIRRSINTYATSDIPFIPERK